MIRLALAQYALSDRLEDNVMKALDQLKRAAALGADIVLFPELCTSRFFPQYAKQQVRHLALSLDHEIVHRFRDACRHLGIAASPNLYLEEGKRLFDASLWIWRDGSIQGISKMVHIAQVPGFYEQDYYAPSDTGFRVYQSPLGNVGLVVCFDRHYPESIRSCVLRGASLVLISTANTLGEPRDVFECELRAAAFQNGVFIAMCNRVGTEGDTIFCGDSTVVDPNGNVVAKAGTGEELLLAEIELKDVEIARAQRPYLSLRRPEAYV